MYQDGAPVCAALQQPLADVKEGVWRGGHPVIRPRCSSSTRRCCQRYLKFAQHYCHRLLPRPLGSVPACPALPPSAPHPNFMPSLLARRTLSNLLPPSTSPQDHLALSPCACWQPAPVKATRPCLLPLPFPPAPSLTRSPTSPATLPHQPYCQQPMHSPTCIVVVVQRVLLACAAASRARHQEGAAGQVGRNLRGEGQCDS
jgi:hypothetical protein